MHFPDHLLPAPLLLTAHVLWFTVLVLAISSAPWRQVHANRLGNVLLGAIAALLVLWSFDISVTPGLGFHFLGVTVFTLMFGWSLGIIGVSVATLGLAVNGVGGWESLSCNALLFGVLPVSLSYGIYHLVQERLPHHVFIYIFLCAFAGGILAAGIAIAGAVGLLVAAGIYPFDRIAAEYLPFLPLYLFPEGVLNGMLTTVFIGLRPHWLKTFDDESYLGP